MEKEQALLQMDDAFRPVFDRIVSELGIEDNKKAFLMLASYGYLMKAPATDYKKNYSVTRTSYLSDEEKALVAAMAMDQHASEPPSMAVAYQLVERYANGGIALIQELLDSPKGFGRSFREIVDQELRGWRAELREAAEGEGVGVELPE